MKRILPIAFSLLSSSAFAVNLQFNFDVNSSGPSIYACDAGLRHEAHASTICYDRETQQACSPSTSGEDQNCICSGPSAEEHKMDNMVAGTADWSDNGGAPTNVGTASVPAGDSSFARIFAGNSEWNKQITSLVFNFGSSRYGSEFYLDVCYRGPQVRQQGSPNHAIALHSTITDLVAANYSELADLNIKVTATCDIQGEGTHQGLPDLQANQITGVTGGDVTHTTDYASFASGATLNLLTEWINNGNNRIPRFCKVRFSFIEDIRNSNDPLEQLRKWEKQQARISTLTNISQRNNLNN
jgi:hypothetical protein